MFMPLSRLHLVPLTYSMLAPAIQPSIYTDPSPISFGSERVYEEPSLVCTLSIGRKYSKTVRAYWKVTMVSDRVFKLCQEAPTVSSEFAKKPSEAPTEIAKRLYGNTKPASKHDFPGIDRPPASVADLERALQCGKWGPSKPSEFFLRVWNDVLSSLDADPLGGMVSPPLMGSYGTMPLAVIAPLADVVRHMSNLIVRAEREVFLITCSWSPSVAVHLVSDALKELSRRAGQRGGRVVVKVMYDKAGAAQFINNRQPVKPEVYSG